MRAARRSLTLVGLLVVAVLAVPAAGNADPMSGGLNFVECVTGMGSVAGGSQMSRGGGCKVTRTATVNSEGSAVDHLFALTPSPDGRSLYAVSSRDDAVSAFAARPLRMTQCFTTNSHLRKRGKQPCQLLPNPGTEDVNSGFNGLHFVAVSPDDRNVYTVSSDDSIATFSRAPSGRISFEGCITGDLSQSGSAANGSCEPIPGATEYLDGAFSGLAGPRSLAISPDGRFVYVALGQEAGIATLARAADGSLRFVSCLRGGSPYVDSSGFDPSPCPLVAPEANNPNGSGLLSATRIVISPDGTSLYATSPRQSAIAEFRRDSSSGALTFSGCLSGANRGGGPHDPCRYVPQANGIGVDTAMEMREIAITSDGTGLYGVSTYDNAVAAFARNPSTGRLSFTSCIGAESNLGKTFGVPDPCTKVPAAGVYGEGSGLRRPRGLAISPSGRSLFVASSTDAAIDRFRLTANGGLHLVGCLTTSPTVARCARARAQNGKPQLLGFDRFNSLAVAGHSLYAAAGRGASVSRLSFP